MIISHKHKFIFIKTEKTAGTSIEIALSKYCGPQHIITPISPEDEAIRQQLGFPGPQNYKIPLGDYSRRDLMEAIYYRRRLEFMNHVSAVFIRRYIKTTAWDSYYKFCFERNPWDKVVSWYYYRFPTEPRQSISSFIQSSSANHIRGFELYSSVSNIVVDKVFRFEELTEAMIEIGEKFNFGETPYLPKTKTGFRKDKRTYRELLTENDRDKISKAFAREIAYFDYKW